MNKFGKYQVVEKIAQGGMAEVFMDSLKPEMVPSLGGLETS